MGAKLGGGGGDRYVIEQNADINVTPFVDIMLVLLIIRSEEHTSELQSH